MLDLPFLFKLSCTVYVCLSVVACLCFTKLLTTKMHNYYKTTKMQVHIQKPFLKFFAITAFMSAVCIAVYVQHAFGLKSDERQ